MNEFKEGKSKVGVFKVSYKILKNSKITKS